MSVEITKAALRCQALARLPFDQANHASIIETENLLIEALLAVKLAISELEKKSELTPCQ